MPLGLDLPEGEDRLPDLSGMGGIILVAALVGATYALVRTVSFLAHVFSALDQAIENKTDLASLCATLAVILGAILFALRRRYRGVYAVLELGFAFGTAWFSITKLHSQGDAAVWFGFAGAAYLVVRGLDNLETARESRSWPWSLALTTAIAPLHGTGANPTREESPSAPKTPNG
jgi:hypothetical protein